MTIEQKVEAENLYRELDDILDQIESGNYSDEEILNNIHMVSIVYETEIKEMCENMRV